MLGDMDRQQSSRAWLKRRDAALPAIAPWADYKMLRMPTSVTHVVLDTPGGLHGFDLARVVMFADAIIMPVCNSIFDRDSAAACHAELMSLPRVANGRCKLATIGMRIDGKTQAAQTLREWSEDLGVSYLGALRETQLYVRSLERGMTIFDLPAQTAAADMQQWEPILEWLQPLLFQPQAANDASPASPAAALANQSYPPGNAYAQSKFAGPSTTSVGPARPDAARVGSSLPRSLMPAQESLVHGGRMSVLRSRQAVVAPVLPSGKPAMTRNANSSEGLQIPHFLKREPR